MKIKCLAVLAFLICGWAGAADAASHKVPERIQTAMAALGEAGKPVELKASDAGAYYALLPNGCEIIIQEKHSAPVVTVQAWVRTGAIHEGKWMGAGLSHFCEHMLFKGTTKRPTGVLDQEIRGSGGDDNAYTTSDRTVYHITTAREGFDVAFSALADMLMDSTFPPQETIKEHAVVVKEIERYLDDPDSMLWDAFARTLYQTHPYGVPVLGYTDRFKAVTREEVFAYYQQRYTPQNCAFIAVGDFDAAVVMPAMAKILMQWKRKSVEPSAIAVEPPQVASRSVELTHPLSQVSKIMLGFPTVSLRNPDLYALDVLASVLGDGRASRLYRSVKDSQGLVSEISCASDTPQYMGWLGVNATVESGRIKEAGAAILKVLEDIKTTPPNDEELARAKRKIFTRHVFSQMTAEGVAGDLGSNWFEAGDLDFSAHYTARIQQVTAADVARVAKTYVVSDRLNTVVMLPQTPAAQAAKQADAGAQAAKQADAGAQDGRKARLEALRRELAALKADASVENAMLLEDKGVFEFTLKSSGVRVVVREDRSLPVVNGACAVLGGTRWEPAELAGAGNLLAEMLDHGTQKRDKLAIAEAVEGMGASLATFSEKDYFGISFAGLGNDLPVLMDIAAERLLIPQLSEAALEQVKGRVLRDIAEDDEDLFGLSGNILRPLLYGAHPYSRPKNGTPETVVKVTVQDLRKLHEAWVRPEVIAVGFVGDISALVALELARKHFGSLTRGSAKPPETPQVAALDGVKKGEGSKAEISGAILTLGFRGVELKHADRESLDVIAALLSGLGGRLGIALRGKQGLAYVVGVHNDSQLDGGAVVFFIQTDAKGLEKAEAGMWEEIRKLREELVPEKELESVKNFLVGSESIALQDQSDVAQRLALSQLYQEGASHIFGRKQRLEKVTPEQIKAAAVKYLDPQKYARLIFKAKE
jgi:zinc protease